MKPATIFGASLLALLQIGVASQAMAADTRDGKATASPKRSLCQTQAVKPLVFGDYDPTAESDTYTAASLSIKCSKDVFVTVSFDTGATPGASASQRLMTNGADTLAYNLYLDGNCTTVLDPRQNLSASTGKNVARPTTFNVYGKIARNQYDVAPGNYSDSVRVTISY